MTTARKLLALLAPSAIVPGLLAGPAIAPTADFLSGNVGCWYANTGDYPGCLAYKSVGFTCVGTHCAQMDPDYPSLSACARKAAAGTVLDAITGTCVPVPGTSAKPCRGMCWNFTYTCRVASIEAAPWETPAERARPRTVPANFTWHWGKVPVTSSGTGWTPVTPFLGQVDGAEWARLYPNTGGLWFAQHWSVEHITVTSTPPRPVNDTSLWNVECQLGGGDFMRTPTGALVPVAGDFLPLTGKLWGRNDLGVLVINTIPCPTCPAVPKSNAVTTMLRYNQQHFGPSFASAPAVTQKTKHFPITDGYTGGDTDYSNALWGLTQMDRIGFHGLCYGESDRHSYEILKALGQNLTIGAFSNGSPFVTPGTGGTFNTSIMDAWADKQAAPYKAAGWGISQVANIAIADEPGWYFPTESPEKYMNTSTSIYAARQKAEWVAYLEQQQPRLAPMDFGAPSWEAVIPSPQRWDWVGNKTLPLAKKKLFFWTVKFSIHASAVAFSRATKALERAFAPGVPVFSNFNNFHGRAYVPSGRAGDGAALGEDMFEFARNRATTLLWTEDWFGDGKSGQWYKGFDIILDHISRLSEPCTTPHAPWAMLYLVPMLGIWPK